MITVAANQDETIDAITYRVLKMGSGVVEQVMALNPNLAGKITLPHGTLVNLPEPSKVSKPQNKITNLWD